MAVNELRKEQLIPAPLEHVWAFFSNPGNLSTITPEYMKFTVTEKHLPPHIYPGQVITYKVSPVFHIPLFWMTEITHVVEKKYFVDEQRQGPYKLWHHQHFFEQKTEGVLMTDMVHYKLPFGPLGKLAHVLFVQRQLEYIFEFRHKKIEQIFS